MTLNLRISATILLLASSLLLLSPSPSTDTPPPISSSATRLLATVGSYLRLLLLTTWLSTSNSLEAEIEREIADIPFGVPLKARSDGSLSLNRKSNQKKSLQELIKKDQCEALCKQKGS